MWTNFQNSFTRRFVRKFSMYKLQRFPPNLQYFATLPCESQKYKNVTDWQHLNTVLMYSCEHFEDLIDRPSQDCWHWLTDWQFEVCQMTSWMKSWTLFSWTLLHHGDNFTMIIFAPPSFFLGYTSYIVHILKQNHKCDIFVAVYIRSYIKF